MKNKGSHGQNRFIRILALPWKALIKARDCYVGTMTNYAVVNPRSLPKSYSVTSSTRSDNSEDFRELVRAASARRMGENFELNLLIQQQIRQQLQQQMPSRRSVPRSVSVGMGRIDEDKPFVLGGPITFEAVEYNGSFPKMILNPYSWTKTDDGQVRDALNIRKGSIGKWETCASNLQYNRMVMSSIPYHKNLSSKGYRSLIYRYVGVGDSEDVQLFYYFIESESEPDSDPLMLWITGGPGCSALSGLIYEIGPITFEAVSSIIFLDLPVGTGFSYATTPAALQSSDLQASEHAYQFLRKYYALTFCWSCDNTENEIMEVEPFINLKSLKSNCKGEYFNINPSNALCLQDVQTFNELLKGINNPHILEPKCKHFSPRPHQLFGVRRSLDEKLHELNNLPGLKCRNNWYKHSYHWADNDQVRDALNIRKGTIGKWERCASNLQYQMMVTNNIPYHENLSRKGYRSLIYSGDHDKLVTFQSTQAWIKSLNYSVVNDWRAWTVDSEVAGLYVNGYK
ncbi:hypothetical protein RDI58_011743 [Solanum bulbocastanum]|uniref:Uncharacterized protein n=1 Tax=Solanum bulbocastanum TaxID=147425 RepID=A0AAN8TVS5_SOLBU